MIIKIKTKIKKIINKEKKNEFEKISYSQCGEDLIVESIFNQIGINTPSYLDIGAHHPFFLSNTAIFYKNGSRGINIEPDPNLFKKIEQYRKEDINLNIGIGVQSGVMDFYIMNAPALNTFSLEQIALYKNEGNYFVNQIKQVNVETVNNIINETNKGIFPDFLSLDAEGIDEIVIKNINYSTRPKVICVETLSFSNSGNGAKNHSLIKHIVALGYMLYADTYINSIFVDKNIWDIQEIK